MKKPPFVSEARACEQGKLNTQGEPPKNPPEPPRFLGTINPRHLRVIAALEERPLLREELDRVANSLCLVFFVVLPVYDPLMRGEMA